VSALLLSLSTMLHMELPHINVLSKIDLIENYGELGTEASFFEFEHFASHGIRCICF
jgi:GPN-loop GTPase